MNKKSIITNYLRETTYDNLKKIIQHYSFNEIYDFLDEHVGFNTIVGILMDNKDDFIETMIEYNRYDWVIVCEFVEHTDFLTVKLDCFYEKLATELHTRLLYYDYKQCISIAVDTINTNKLITNVYTISLETIHKSQRMFEQYTPILVTVYKNVAQGCVRLLKHQFPQYKGINVTVYNSYYHVNIGTLIEIDDDDYLAMKNIVELVEYIMDDKTYKLYDDEFIQSWVDDLIHQQEVNNQPIVKQLERQHLKKWWLSSGIEYVFYFTVYVIVHLALLT